MKTRRRVSEDIVFSLFSVWISCWKMLLWLRIKNAASFMELPNLGKFLGLKVTVENVIEKLSLNHKYFR